MPIIVTPPVDNSVHVQTQSQQVIQANEASALNGEKHGLIRQGDKCLDVMGEGQRDGTPVIMYACHAKANQQWYRDGQQLRNVQMGKWLTTTAKQSGHRKLSKRAQSTLYVLSSYHIR